MNVKLNALIASGAITLSLAGPAQAQRGNPPAPPRPVAAPRPPAPPEPPADEWFDSRGVTRIDTVVAFDRDGSVELGLGGGSIKVSSWDRAQVRVVATASNGAGLDFDAGESHLDLSVHGNMMDRMGTATFDVTVPTGARLSLNSISGSITSVGVRGATDASTVSGAIDIRNAGRVTTEGVSGATTITGAKGDVRVETVSGPIIISDVDGTASVENVSGRIELSNIRGGRVRANTVSGSLTFTGALNPSGRYEFETHSGRASLVLAPGASAAVSVETLSGSVSNEYPGAVRRPEEDPEEARTNYNYVIGRGDARVSIETFSGRVQISQGNR